VSLQAGAQISLTFSGAEGTEAAKPGVQARRGTEAAACSGFVVEKEEQKSLVKSL
jgi:hypothetical protein